MFFIQSYMIVTQLVPNLEETINIRCLATNHELSESVFDLAVQYVGTRLAL